MPFSVRKVLRQIPSPRLQAYFAARGASIDVRTWKKPEPKLATALADYLIAEVDQTRDSILEDLVRIDPMSNEEGHRAILNAVAKEPAIVDALALMANDYERSLWTLMNHDEAFREAEELLFFDHYARGTRSHHSRTEPDRLVSQEDEDIDQFRKAVCAYYRREEGSGASCHVEFADRHQDGSHQTTLYVQGLPNRLMEFVAGDFQRSVSFPAKEAAIVYEPTSGAISTVIRGGKDAHAMLREAFARFLLKTEPKFDAVIPTPFTLNKLLKAPVLAPEPELGVAVARVRQIKLAPANYGVGSLVLEAPADKPDVSVFDLADRWLKGGFLGCQRFAVIHATIALHLHPVPGQKRTRKINIELTKPNSSNLKSMKDSDREIAEAHIAKWKLREPAA